MEERLLIVDGFDLPEAKTVSFISFNDNDKDAECFSDKEGLCICFQVYNLAGLNCREFWKRSCCAYLRPINNDLQSCSWIGKISKVLEKLPLSLRSSQCD